MEYQIKYIECSDIGHIYTDISIGCICAITVAQQEAGHGDAQSMVMTPRPVTNSALKTFSTIEVGEAKNR